MPGKPGTIFADGRFPVVLDFRKSSCFGLPTAHVPEEFGSNLEIREKHLDNQQFEGVPISCYNTVWGTYALALRCLVPPSQAVPNTSIKTILLKVQESKFTSFENYDDKCYGKEEWTHIIAKYVPKVDEKRGGGVRCSPTQHGDLSSFKQENEEGESSECNDDKERSAKRVVGRTGF